MRRSTRTIDEGGGGEILATRRSLCLFNCNSLRSFFARRRGRLYRPGRPEGASARRRVEYSPPIHLSGCHRTRRARARAGIPNHIPIDFYAEKSRLFSVSLSLCLPPSLLHSLSSKPNPFGGARSQKLSTLYIISLLPSASVRQSVRSLARSHMQHACIQSPIIALDEVLHIS